MDGQSVIKPALSGLGMQSGCIIQTFSSENFCNHVFETRPEVCSAGNVTRGFDNGGEPGEEVAWEVEAGVQAGPGICQLMITHWVMIGY